MKHRHFFETPGIYVKFGVTGFFQSMNMIDFILVYIRTVVCHNLHNWSINTVFVFINAM